VKRRVVVVGGSLGGLNAALWLRDAGCDVEVFERARAPLEGRGAGIALNPATIRYVDVPAVAARCVRYLADDGSTAHEEPCSYRLTSYNALYDGLLDRLDPDRYHLGAECVDFEHDPLAAVFADGRRERCDLLVFADGINSTGRRLLLPHVEPQYAGYVAWRGIMDAVAPSLEDAVTYHVRPDGHAIAYPIPGRVFNWLWYRNVEAGPELDDLLTGKAGVRSGGSLPPGLVREEHVRALHADAEALPPPFAELLTRTPEPFIQVIVDVAVPRMAFERVCLIGDAAFALRPHVAAGTAKAAEDGWKLAESLRRCEGLEVWETRQLSLGRAALLRARAAGERLQSGRWRTGEPLPYGLYREGDSSMAKGGPWLRA
jgi:2,6-dihydroxypyridine 3-monooxygenase